MIHSQIKLFYICTHLYVHNDEYHVRMHMYVIYGQLVHVVVEYNLFFSISGTEHHSSAVVPLTPKLMHYDSAVPSPFLDKVRILCPKFSLNSLIFSLTRETKKNILNDEIDQFFQIAKSQMAFLHNYFIIQDFFFQNGSFL